MVLACSEEKIASEEGPNDVKAKPIVDADIFIVKEFESPIEVIEVIEFNNKYIFGGFDGFFVTDQSLNELGSYEQDMIVDQLINYNDDFACICTTEGIFKVDNNLAISKIIDLPCTDMEVDSSGKILFVSGTGELSQQTQITANILALDVNEQRFELYSDPKDSIGTFLNQMEIMSTGEIFALGSNATVYHYQNKKVTAKYSKDNVDFFPVDIV